MTDESLQTPPRTPAAPKRKKAAAPRTPGAAKYEARFCVDVVEFMGKGYSLTAFAGEIGATRAQLTLWSEKYPTFAVAVGRAQARRARLLEDRLLSAKGANAFGAHMQALKTAAPDEWPDKPSRPAGKPGSGRRVEVSVALPDNGRDPA